MDGNRIRVVIIPLGTDEYLKGFAAEVAIREAAELPRMLAKIENDQASFQIMRPSTSSRTTLLLCTLPPKKCHPCSARFRRSPRVSADLHNFRGGRNQGGVSEPR